MNNYLWLIYAVVAAVMWGLDYTLAQRLLKQSVSPVFLIAFQSFIGGLFFLLVGVSSVDILKKNFAVILQNKYLLIIFLLTVVTFNLANFLVFLAIRGKNAAVAGMVELTYPFFVIIFSWLLFRENYLEFKVLVGGILVILGVSIISL